MIKAIIVDDEINNSNYLNSLLQNNLPTVEICGIAANVKDAIQLILEKKPNIVFLDIELQTASGFDLLNQLSNIDFSVIFTTAHQHYALKAIKFAALDFLLKPIDVEELRTAVNKAIKQQNDSSFGKNMEVFLKNIQQQNVQKKIAISTSESIIVLEIKDIIYCQSDGPYTNIFLSSSKIMSSKHLKEYENLITEYGFFRVHKSFLVNIAEIRKYVRSDGGYVVMSNGDKVSVSEKKKEDLMSKFCFSFSLRIL